MVEPKIKTSVEMRPDIREKLENLKEQRGESMRDIIEEAIEREYQVTVHG